MYVFDKKPGAKYRRDYGKIADRLNALQKKKNSEEAIGLIRSLAKQDLFFLMYFVLGMTECNHPWIVERIKEVEKAHDRTLDLWARAHWKSNTITYALTIQKILQDPDRRICIFSETRQIAKSFLRRIKTTFEGNMILRGCFPDIFYDNPERQSPKWSEDDGIIVIRKQNYTEATVEAWGVDSLPTGKHFDIMVYDDLVSEKTVSTSDQMEKLENGFRLSFGLMSSPCEMRIIGTIYHYQDLNQRLSESGEWFTRKHPALDDNGTPVLLSKDELDMKKRDMGSYVFACQMMLNPIAKDKQVFHVEQMRYYRSRPESMNMAIFVDPADAQKRNSDYTIMGVIGVDSLHNYFLLDMIRDRLKLTERWDALKGLVNKWACRTVNYEITGQGRIDIQYFKEKMAEDGVFFDLNDIKNIRVDKEKRIISSLQPLFESGRLLFPDTIIYYDKAEARHDLIHEFITEELTRFPFSVHDDMLDMLSMCKHEAAKLPVPAVQRPAMDRKPWNPLETNQQPNYSYMGA